MLALGRTVVAALHGRGLAERHDGPDAAILAGVIEAVEVIAFVGDQRLDLESPVEHGVENGMTFKKAPKAKPDTPEQETLDLG